MFSVFLDEWSAGGLIVKKQEAEVEADERSESGGCDSTPIDSLINRSQSLLFLFFFFFLQFMVLQHLIAGCVFTSSWRGLPVNEFPLNSVEDDEDNEPHKGADPGSI